VLPDRPDDEAHHRQPGKPVGEDRGVEEQRDVRVSLNEVQGRHQPERRVEQKADMGVAEAALGVEPVAIEPDRGQQRPRQDDRDLHSGAAPGVVVDGDEVVRVVTCRGQDAEGQDHPQGGHARPRCHRTHLDRDG
jgi:hypothetical protein